MNNIQDILTTTQMPVNPYSKLGEDDKSAKEDFMALMAGSFNSEDLTVKEPEPIDINKELETKVSVSNNVKNSVKDKIKTEDKTTSVTPKDENKVKEEYTKFDEGVKKVLTEELDVSEEELNTALETLGLSLIDLTDPKNLASLINEIKGEDGGVNLLLDTSVVEIIDGMSELTGNLFNETGLDAIGISNFLEEHPVTLSGEIELNPSEFEPVVLGEETVVPVEVNAQAESYETSDVPVVSETFPNTEAAEATAVGTETIKSEETEVKDKEPNVSAKEVAVSNIREERPADNRPVKESDTEDAEDISAGVNVLKDKMVTREGNDSNSSLTDNQNNGQAETFKAPTSEPNVAEHANVGQPTQTFSESIQTFENGETVVTYTNVDTADVINQIVTQASTTITRDVSTMELLLNPQNLGRMLMQVSEQEGQITAKFITQNEAVKNALEGAIANLVEKLNDQGIKVDAVEVSVGTHEFEENLEKNFEGDAREDLQGQQTGDGGEGQRGNRSRGGIHLGDASYMEGSVLSEEEELEANIMRTYGNTVNFRA